MTCQKFALVTLAVLGFGLPAQAEEPFFESEIVQEVPLPDGSLLRTVQTTEVIVPETEDEPIVEVVEPEGDKVCLFVFSDGLPYYDYNYDARFGRIWGNACFATRLGQSVLGVIVFETDI